MTNPPPVIWNDGKHAMRIGEVGKNVAFVIRAEQLRDDLGHLYIMTFLCKRKHYVMSSENRQELEDQSHEIWRRWFDNLYV